MSPNAVWPGTIWSFASRLAAVSVVAATAASCAAPPDRFAPACPGISFLKDGADITRFRAGGQDVTDMVLDGKLTGVQGSCAAGENSTVNATMKVAMNLTRGPAAQARDSVLTFFVAATEGDRVLDEQDYTLHANFPPNIDHGTFTSDDIKLVFPVSKDKSAAAYHVYVGYRLTSDELAYNRRRGAR